MKKNSLIALALFLVASCNNNKDQEADKTQETAPAENNNEATISPKWPLSGKFDVIDYKKDTSRIKLPTKVIL